MTDMMNPDTEPRRTDAGEARRSRGGLAGKTITGAVLGLAVIACFSLWGDASSVRDVLARLPVAALLLATASTLASYLLRLAKWTLLLAGLDIRPRARDNLPIFFTGLAMSITPGKLGELLKIYMLRKANGAAPAKSAAAIFMDRLTDLLAVLLLFGIGMAAISRPSLSLGAAALLFAALIGILQSRSGCLWIIGKLTGPRPLRRFKPALVSFYEAAAGLFGLRSLLPSLLLSLAAWGLECLSLYILTESLHLRLSLLKSVLVFTSGTTAGALSMLPGGLGAAEGSLTALLLHFGVDRAAAVSVALLVRLVTLWLGVVIGMAFFFASRRRLLAGERL